MTVWKDSRRLGADAGKIAVRSARGETSPDLALSAVEPTVRARFRCVRSSSQPVAVERADLGEVIASGWATRAEICAGVDPLRCVPALLRRPCRCRRLRKPHPI